jgi:hypothetical protein
MTSTFHKQIFHFLFFTLIVFGFAVPIRASGGAIVAQNNDPLAISFISPPRSARLWAVWRWDDAELSSKTIAKRLYELHQSGFGGAVLFWDGSALPEESPESALSKWHDFVNDAIKEATHYNLGIAIRVNSTSLNAGVSIKPLSAMKNVMISSSVLRGPIAFSGYLPAPTALKDRYHDIAVIAFQEKTAAPDQKENVFCQVQGSDPQIDSSLLDRESKSRFAWLALPQSDSPVVIQLKYDAPFTARSFSLSLGPSTDSISGDLEAIDGDALSHRHIASFVFRRSDGVHNVSFPAASAVGYRIVIKNAEGRNRHFSFGRISFSPEASGAGGGETGGDFLSIDQMVSGGDDSDAIDADKVVDLTSHIDGTGTLNWNAPVGDWKVLRIGWVSSTESRDLAVTGDSGLHYDPLSASGAQDAFQGAFGEILGAAGHRVPQTLSQIDFMDSATPSGWLWTNNFRAEFIKRRGYDPIIWFPVLDGEIVGGQVQSGRFLWDYRKTVAELTSDSFYRNFNILCHQEGIVFSSFSNSRISSSVERLRNADVSLERTQTPSADSDIQTSFSWPVLYGAAGFASLEISTSSVKDIDGSLENAKTSIDNAYVKGYNLVAFHAKTADPFWGLPSSDAHSVSAAHSASIWDKLLGKSGSVPPPPHSPELSFSDYAARCQTALSVGRPVKDFLFYCGEQLPGSEKMNSDLAALSCNPIQALSDLTGASVRDGKIVLSDGSSYYGLILDDSQEMRPETLVQVERLAKMGAVVIGPKPLHSPSLQDYPAADKKLTDLANAVWGACDGGTTQENLYGKGRIIWGKNADQIVSEIGIVPDFSSDLPDAPLAWIHRSDQANDLYFISNQQSKSVRAICHFRAVGKIVQIWRPENGSIAVADGMRQSETQTSLPLYLGPKQSAFVLIRRPAARIEQPKAQPKAQPKKAAPPVKIKYAKKTKSPKKATSIQKQTPRQAAPVAVPAVGPASQSTPLSNPAPKSTSVFAPSLSK